MLSKAANKIVQSMVLLACSLSLIGNIQPALACGPFYDEAQFSATVHPDMPFRLYVDGDLALIDPTFARSYLVVAYRYLNGKPLSSAEREQVLNFWKFRLGGNSASESEGSVNQWLAARNKAVDTKVSKIDSIYPYRTAGTTDDYNPYLNCNDDAFKQATKTLQDKITKYGAGSVAVKEWLAAQDSVFCHCGAPQYDYKKNAEGKEPPLPQPAPAGASDEVKRERAYQIASANFYVRNFDAAAKEFAAIAQDAGSPYQKISAYLVARCLIRKATVSTSKGIDQAAMTAAQAKLIELKNDPSMASMKESIDQLLTFVALRLDAKTTLGQLSKKISAGDDSIYQDLDGYLFILDTSFQEDSENSTTTHKVADAKLAELMRNDDMTDWIWTFSSDDKESTEHALARYRSRKDPAWLLAIGSKLKGNEPYAAEVISELAKVEKSNPAFVTANYQRGMALFKRGEHDLALAAFDAALAATRAPSAMNELNLQKLYLAKSLEQLLTLAYRSPAMIISEAESQDLAEIWNKSDKSKDDKSYATLPVILRPEGASTINERLPLTQFMQAAQSNQVAPALRKDIAQAAFCRSVLLHDQASATRAGALLKQYMPALTPYLTKYDLSAPDAKEFSAVYFMLKNPGARPYVTAGVARTTEFSKLDDYQDNWWAPLNHDKATVFAGQEFLKSPELTKAKSELATIAAYGAAPDYLGRVVIDYGRKHQADPRVPEALHLVVRATKLGSTDDKTSAISKQAFQLLHQNYKGNPWTAKTPYYY